MNDRYGDKYRVHNLVKFDYSEIGEYVDENHTDKPLRNDEIVKLLNDKDKKINELMCELMRYKAVIFNNDGEKLLLYELKEK